MASNTKHVLVAGWAVRLFVIFLFRIQSLRFNECKKKNTLPLRQFSFLTHFFDRFIRFQEKWKYIATLEHRSWGKQQATCWLAPRPRRRGGQWGIGCIFCAHLVHVLADAPEERKKLPLVDGIFLAFPLGPIFFQGRKFVPEIPV